MQKKNSLFLDKKCCTILGMSEVSDATGYWEKLLAAEGMPTDLPEEQLGKRIPLGNGLGIKTEEEERDEDEGGHSRMCPIKLGVAVSTYQLDQPKDNPVETQVLEELQ